MKPFISTLLLLMLFVSTKTIAEENALQLASLGNIGNDVVATQINLNMVLQNLNQRLLQQPNDHEASLVKALIEFRSGNRKGAITILDQIIKQAPDFHLAYLIKGDLLLSGVQPVTGLGTNSVIERLLDDENRSLLENLRDEAQTRLIGVSYQPYQSMLPKQILALGDSVKTALLVDKARHRLYVYVRNDDGQLTFVRDYYVSTGKLEGNKNKTGDLKTPEGVYFVISWIPPEKLPDKYGIGAFPVNYPNELDQHLGKTGYGIWLHGTESQYYSRPPLDSEGCVVLTNKDLQELKSLITPGTTPVVITEKIDWLDRQLWQQTRLEVLKALDSWRNDWQSMDVEQYLSHYAENFWSKGYDIHSWKSRKRNISQSKTFQKIRLTDISLLAYPQTENQDGEEIVVAKFRQEYQSNNFNSEMHKRLYLKRQSGHWKIFYEGR